MQSELDALKARVAELEAKVTERDNYNAMARNKFEEHKGVLRGAVKDLESEVARLRSGGCARDQGTTQFCAEAAALVVERDALKACVAEREAENDSLHARLKEAMLYASSKSALAKIAELKSERDALRSQLEEARRRMEGARQSIIGLSEGSDGFCWCCGCSRSHRTDTCLAFAGVVASLGLQESPAPQAKEEKQ